MGTRSITHVYEMPHLGGKLVGSFYRQYDSYPSGHGKELVDFLINVKLTNGWTMRKDYSDADYYNRSGRMIIDLMSSFGGDNVELIMTEDSDTEEYTYFVTYDETKDQFKLKIKDFSDIIFDDHISKFYDWLEDQE